MVLWIPLSLGMSLLLDLIYYKFNYSLCSLGDDDDDVRSVAASCLLPVASQLVEYVPSSLDRVLAVLWDCLSKLKDDLSSSVGAVMDLLGESLYCLNLLFTHAPSGKLVTYDEVIQILADPSRS